MSETVLQEGSLGDLPLIDILLLARSSNAPIFVELSRGSTTRRFYFRDGSLVAFTTTNAKESFTEFLVRRKKLQRSVAESVLQVAATDGMTAAQAILRDRILPTPDVARELGAWASLLLTQAFSWSEGGYRVLVESSDAVPPETLMEVSLPPVLAQGVWKRMPLEEVRRYIEVYLDFHADSVAELPFPIEDFRLNPARARLWELLRSKRTVRDAIGAAGLPEEEALRLVFLLQRSGMVEMVPAAPEAPAPEPEDAMGFDLDSIEIDVGGGSVAPPPPRGPAPSAPSAPSVAPARGAGGANLDIARWLSESGEYTAAEDEVTVPPIPVVTPPPPSPRLEPLPVDPTPPPAPSFAAPGAPSYPTPAAASPAGGRSDLGVDLSSIGFRGGGGAAGAVSRTVHVGGGRREELGGAGGRHRVSSPAGRAPAPPSAPRHASSPATKTPGRTSGLAGLFEDVGVSGASQRRPVAPPRGVKPRAGGRPVKPPRGMAPVAPQPVVGDGPPPGPGPLIEPEEWHDLPTKEKDRVRGLREMLKELESQNYFEVFELSEEATAGMIKKAYFKMARRFHPDTLVDEGEVYSRLAEAVFTRVSEAYETLDDDEAREKYVSKYIRGEKDENELAMERVQQILGAEGAYKNGIRLINQGKAVAAVEKFEEAVAMYDEEAEYRGWLGYALFRANQAADYEKALGGEDMLKQAISEKPMVADLPHLMAKIAIMRKDWNNARMWLRKSLKIKADNPEALREYKRVDEMIKGGGAKAPDEGKGLKGLFGRFGKK
ncbi:MAG: DnaJ domain-containing protein [Deltaproteobacteria bacterium]|nr:DnaJ domain-containing protein [Deltaproteobacteria bacterium]